MSLKRAMKEFELFQNYPIDDIKVRLVDNNDYRHWKGIIKGPIDTCYQGGIFIIDIIIPNEYPLMPPKMKFDTKVWHPNVSSITGEICLNILGEEWSPSLTIRTTLLSIQVFLGYPNPEEPKDVFVAKQYISNIKLFKETVKKWVEIYASHENL